MTDVVLAVGAAVLVDGLGEPAEELFARRGPEDPHVRLRSLERDPLCPRVLAFAAILADDRFAECVTWRDRLRWNE
jgi:hypothetical protein